MPDMHPAVPASHTTPTKKQIVTSQDRPSRFIRLPEVKVRVGLSRSTIYNRIAAKTFPPPIRLGEKSVAWLESSIDAWIQNMVIKADLETAS